MKRSRFTEDQIIGILKEHEAGVSVADLCRKHGVSDATVDKWNAKYGWMDVSEAKRLKGLEDENARLKRLLADAMLDNAALKDLLGKSGDARRKAASGRASGGKSPPKWQKLKPRVSLSLDKSWGQRQSRPPCFQSYQARRLQI